MLKCSAESGPGGGLVIYGRFLRGKAEKESKVYNFSRSVKRKGDVGKVLGLRLVFQPAQETQQRCIKTKDKYPVKLKQR